MNSAFALSCGEPTWFGSDDICLSQAALVGGVELGVEALLQAALIVCTVGRKPKHAAVTAAFFATRHGTAKRRQQAGQRQQRPHLQSSHAVLHSPRVDGRAVRGVGKSRRTNDTRPKAFETNSSSS